MAKYLKIGSSYLVTLLGHASQAIRYRKEIFTRKLVVEDGWPHPS